MIDPATHLPVSDTNGSHPDLVLAEIIASLATNWEKPQFLFGVEGNTAFIDPSTMYYGIWAVAVSE